MATYSILTSAKERAEPSATRSATGAPKLVIAATGEAGSPEESASATSEPFVGHEDHDSPEPPTVALQLPDLATAADPSPDERRFPMRSIVYWTGIALGTILAISLIWTPKKAPLPATDEAPIWSPNPPGQADSAFAARSNYRLTPAPQSPQSSEAASSANPCSPPPSALNQQPPQPPASTRPASQQPLPPADSAQPPAPAGGPFIQNGASRQHPQAQAPPPSHDAVPGASQAPPDVRTASGPSPRWDGSSNHVGPSEAAPLGITTPVQP